MAINDTFGPKGFPGDEQPRSAPISSGAPQNDDEIDLKRLFLTLWSYKVLILSAVLLGSVIAFLFARYQTPIYRAQGLMMIEEQRNRYQWAGSDLGSMLSSTYGIGMGRRIPNELAVLRSRQFASTIADSILSNPVMEDGRLHPILFRQYPEDSTLVPIETVVGRIRGQITYGQQSRDNDVIAVSFESPSPMEAQKVVRMVLNSYAEFSTNQQRQQARAAIVFLDREGKSVQGRLQRDEQRLRDFMDREGIVQLNEQSRNAVEQLANLEAEREATRIKRVAVEQARDSYREQLDRIRPGLAMRLAQNVSPRLERFQFELAEQQTRKFLLELENPRLRDYPDEEPRMREINRKIRDLEHEISAIIGDLQQGGPEQLLLLNRDDGSFATRINSLTNDVFRAEVEVAQLLAQEKVLSERIEQRQAFFDRLPDNMLEMARIQRDIRVSESLFLTINQQSAELAVWEQTQSGIGRVVDYPIIPRRPVAPRTNLILMIGIVLGGMLGVGMVFILEMFQNKINSVQKLRERGLTVLSVVPDFQDLIQKEFSGEKSVRSAGYKLSTGLVTLLDSISNVAESFRRLQSNIIYSQPDVKFNTLMVTSANKSEGKSTVSANLAVALAESGRSVIIIDCDFRRPNQHKVWGLPSEPGVVDILFDQLAVEDVVQETIVENIKVLTAGQKPPNPAAVNRSRSLMELIEYLKKQYDHVIVDTPPFGIISDAAALAKNMDGVVLVSRFNQTMEPELDNTIESLRRVNANILGAVMTAFDPRKARSDYYGANYYQYVYDSYSYYQKEQDDKA